MTENRQGPAGAETPEEKVSRMVRTGLAAEFDPKEPLSERTIGAQFIRDLLLKCVTCPAIAPVGVAINGARLVGNLHCIAFGSPAAPLPALDLSNCELTGDLELSDSCFSSVTLNGCTLRGLKASSLNVVNGLRASNMSFESATAVVIDLEGLISGSDVTVTNLGRATSTSRQPPCRLRLKQARIAGSLYCSGARLTGDMTGTNTDPSIDRSDAAALLLDGADITGSFALDPSHLGCFEAIGEVRMLGGSIGSLVCTGASFKNPDSDALSLDRVVVSRSVQLNSSEQYRFTVEGEVRLVGATIGGQLALVGAHILNPKRDALSMHRADVRGDVLLQASDIHRFEAVGAVQLVGTKIGGGLDCGGASLDSSQVIVPAGEPPSAALSIMGAEIAGGVWLSKSGSFEFTAVGPIEAKGARIGLTLACEGSFSPRLVAGAARQWNDAAKILDFDNLCVGQRLTIRFEPMSWGEVCLRGARVGELEDDDGEGWRDFPAIIAGGASGVLLKLDGFVYDRLCGAPTNGSSAIWEKRIAWLGRQSVQGAPRPDDYFPQPHEQLAKVLRLMGHDYAARRIACHKSEHEAACGASLNPAMSGLMWLYRTLFGAGYLPSRALLTVIVFWLLGTGLTCWARSMNNVDRVVLARSMVSVELVRWLGIPDLAPMSPLIDRPRDREEGVRILFAPHREVQSRDVPCTEIKAPLYALDLMVPVVGLHVADKCDMASGATWWTYGKAIYEVIGWIIVAMAALTWTGVLRKDTA